MKCKLCEEKKGSTRCEGCNMLLCLSCMNKHHDELLQHFQQLMDIRNELKESLDITETTTQYENELPCLIEINQWERKTIERIQEIAKKLRTDINKMMLKNVADVRYQLEQLSVNMQQQEKEGNYLENDIVQIKCQLDKLKETIQHMNEKIQITTSNDIDWNTLIHITINKNLEEDCGISSKYFGQERSTKSEFQTNQEKPSHKKSTIRYHSNKQSAFRPATPLYLESNDSNSFRPISPPVFSQDNSSDYGSDSPLTLNIVPVDMIVPMLPNQEQPLTWTTIARNRQNT